MSQICFAFSVDIGLCQQWGTDGLGFVMPRRKKVSNREEEGHDHNQFCHLVMPHKEEAMER